MDKIADAVASLKALATSSHKYRAIPLPLTDDNRAHYSIDEPPPRPSKSSKLPTAMMLLAVFLFLGFAFGYVLRPPMNVPI